MDPFESLLDGFTPSGLYRYAGRASSAELLRRATSAGRQGWLLNGEQFDDKRGFLAAAQRALGLPAYFGRNWDAFEECINDLSWQPAAGYLLIVESPFHFARRAPRDWQTAQSILRDAATRWGRQGRPFHILLRRTYGSAPDAPLLGVDL